MATTASYTYSPVQTFVDTNSYTIYKDLPMRVVCGAGGGGLGGSGSGLGNTSPEASYNCTRCEADSDYKMPLLPDDMIHLQTQFPDNVNGATLTHGWNDGSTGDWYVDVRVTDIDGNDVLVNMSGFSPEHMVGRDKDGLPFQNLVIDASFIFDTNEVQCFLLKFIYKNPDNSTTIVYSEPFEFIDEDCIKSLLISSTYNTIDCELHQYADPDQWVGTSNFKHNNVHRFRGTIEVTDLELEDTFNDKNVLTKSRTKNVYTIRLEPIPVYEKRNLAVSWGGSDISVDNGSEIVVLTEKDGFTKNNEFGTMWIPVLKGKNLCNGGEISNLECD